MKNKHSSIVIFSGYNQRAVVAFLRTLVKNSIDDFVIIASSNADSIFLTDYKKYVVYTRRNKDFNIQEIERIFEYVRDITHSESLLIIPSTEYLNRYFLKMRTIMEEKNCYIHLVNEELYQMISDKEKFRKLCRDNEICAPNEVRLPLQYNKAFVAKPKTYFSKDGKVFSPIIVNDEDSYNSFVNNYNLEDFTLEEYVEGRSYYLLYYFTKEGEVYKLSQENYLQQPDGKSILYAEVSDIHNQPVSQQFENLLLKLNFFGLIMIEVRYSMGKYYMIEANPRLWGPSQLFCDAGINFFEIFLKEMGFVEKVTMELNKDKIKYFWTGGYMQVVGNGKMPVFLNLKEEEFAKKFSAIISYDIYNRTDTRKLFVHGL